MPYARADDLEMYYEEHGLPNATPMVLLHGFTATGASTWVQQREAFGKSYRLIVPDWRGHGRTANPSGPSAMNHRRFAADVIAFCRQLAIKEAVFCGQSSGAMLLLSLALAAPELPLALVLSACTHYIPAPLRERWRAMTPETTFSEARNAQLREVHTSMGPDHWREVVAAWLALQSHADSEDYPGRDELRGIRVPTLILHGDRDSFFPVEIPSELYRLLPDAELCVLPNSGHNLPSERPDWVTTIVLDFLARHPAAAGSAQISSLHKKAPASTGADRVCRD